MNTKKYLNLILILLVVIGFTEINQPNDIGLYDESGYLDQGINYKFKLNDGNTYFAFYSLLNKIEKNPIDLYFLSYKSLIISLLILLSFLMTKENKYYIFSIPIFLLLSNDHFFKIWPFISFFSSILIILGIYSLHKNFFYISLIISFLLVYTRPEFTYSFFLIGLLISYISFKNKDLKLFTLLIFLTGITIFNNPTSGSRSYIAFCQHYALNLAEMGYLKDNPWTNCHTVMQESFGNVQSLSKIPFYNFNEFMNHIFINLENYFFKESFFSLKYYVICTVLLGTFFVFFDIKYLITYIGSIIFSIPSVIAISIIYPRDHYILNLISASIGFLLIIKETKFLKLFILLILSLIAINNVSKLSNKNKGPTIGLISCIKQKYSNQNLSILSDKGSICMYMNGNCRHVYEYSKSESFNSFYEKNKFNLIVLSNSLKNDTRFRNDSEFINFISENKDNIDRSCQEEILFIK